MSYDDNPDEVFDDEPEANGGNGDESSNRSFRYMMIGLFAIGVLGVLLIALIFISKQNSGAQFAAEQAMIQQTNEAVIALSQITPTALPTNTPLPTNTAAPTSTPTPTPTPAPKNLVDTAAAAGKFKTLTSLLDAAGLTDLLKGDGSSYTILAPTDNAFAQISPDSLDALKKDPTKLAELLKYHVIQGALKPSDMAALTTTNTLAGTPITITVSDNSTTINGVKVTQPEGASSNGVIYPIDTVLVPPSLKNSVVIVPVTPQAGQATEVAQAPVTPQSPAATTKPSSTSKTTPAASSGTSAAVPTRVPPGPGTVAPSGNITSTQPISGTNPAGMPKTGAGEDLFLLALAAVFLMMVIFAARRLRTMPH